MNRTETPTPRLREMNYQGALFYCANLTNKEWLSLDNDSIIELWTVFRAYIQNDYVDVGLPIPEQLTEVWSRCKVIIDKEADK